MRRRTLLAAVGALAGTGAAGCLSPATSGAPGGTTTRAPRDDTTTAPTTGSPPEFDPGADDPHATVAVGDRENVLLPDETRPHEVRVWNDADESRELAVAVDDDGETRFEESWTVPADGYVTVELLEPGAYALWIGLDGEHADDVEIPAPFDCNDSRTTVRVAPDGSVTTRTISTEMACLGPDVRDHAFEVTDGGCRGSEPEHDATTVSFGGDAITVTGRISAPNPCHGAELAGADWDPEAEEFTLTVATTDPDVATCIECVGSIEYEATVAFADGLPAAVVVEHAHGDRTHVVATAERDR